MTKKVKEFKCPYCEFYPITKDTLLEIKIEGRTYVYASPECKKAIPIAAY